MSDLTRAQVWRAIADAPDATGHSTVLGYLGEPGVDWATDAVMALLTDQDHRVPVSIVERINDGWDYVKPVAPAGRKGWWFRCQDGANNWVLPPGADNLQREPMTADELVAIYGSVVSRDNQNDATEADEDASPVSPAEEKIVDLMQALHDSVEEAKAARDRKLAADAAAPTEDHGCA